MTNDHSTPAIVTYPPGSCGRCVCIGSGECRKSSYGITSINLNYHGPHRIRRRSRSSLWGYSPTNLLRWVHTRRETRFASFRSVAHCLCKLKVRTLRSWRYRSRSYHELFVQQWRITTRNFFLIGVRSVQEIMLFFDDLSILSSYYSIKNNTIIKIIYAVQGWWGGPEPGTPLVTPLSYNIKPCWISQS